MNIGFVVPGLHPGGAERLAVEEARYFYQKGHSVTLYIRGDDDLSFRKGLDADHIPAKEFPNTINTRIRKANIPQEAYWLHKQIISDKTELLFSHYSDIITYISTRNTQTEYSIHINGSPFWFENNSSLTAYQRRARYDEYIEAVPGHSEFQDLSRFDLSSRLYHNFRERLRSKAISQSVLVTTLTDRVADELSFCYDAKPAVIRPGISEDWLSKDLDVSPRDIDGVSTDHLILNVGRLDSRKRNSLLIRSFAEFCNQTQRDDVTLIIGGTGEQGNSLRQLTADLEISDKVVLSGYIPEDELPTYYAAADVLAHPAWVAYGLVPLEAYVMGTKVAISTDTMVREIIEAEPSVQIFDPAVENWADGLREMLEIPNRSPNFDTVPTWSEYCTRKEDLLINNDIITSGSSESPDSTGTNRQN